MARARSGELSRCRLAEKFFRIYCFFMGILPHFDVTMRRS
ncbi:hypothetical protein MPC1_4830002 [Methylocella tundrae]|jgi:hypothetical protein|nr:hypothetical protein MPC1_4830002 [Methylocella tundrae]